MTRREARMIAEEVVKLLKADAMPDDEYMNTVEAAKFLHLSVSYVRHNILRWPHVKRGGRIYFSKRGLIEYINGTTN